MDKLYQFLPEIHAVSQYIAVWRFGIIKCGLFEGQYIPDKSECL